MWQLRLSNSAQEDIVTILSYTDKKFGEIARRRYEFLLITGLRDIAVDPERPGSLARPDIGESVRSYHLRFSRDRARTAEGLVHKPRHLFLYRLAGSNWVSVGRVLHDGMDIIRQVQERFRDE